MGAMMHCCFNDLAHAGVDVDSNLTRESLRDRSAIVNTPYSLITVRGE